MNIKRSFYLLLASVLLFNVSAFADSNLSVESKSVKYKNEYFSADLKIPVVSGLTDSQFQETLNQKLSDYPQGLKNDVESLAKKYYEFSKEENIKMKPYSVKSDYEHSKFNDSVVTILSTFHEYTGGSHENYYTSAYNIDTKSNKELVLSNLFKDGYNYESVILNEIHRKIDLDPSSYFKNAKSSIFNIDDSTRFYFHKNSIVVFYDLYEIAPFATGIPQFKIPCSKFGDNFLY